MSDIEFEKRRIEIQKSKTDHVSEYQGRTIVLPCIAELFLSRLAVSLLKDTFDINGRVFPMTKGAFKQSWADVRKRAKIKDLRFHDLRHEAASRFDEADSRAIGRRNYGHFECRRPEVGSRG